MQDIADFQLPISDWLISAVAFVQIARVVEGIGWWLVRYKPMGNRQLEIGNAAWSGRTESNCRLEFPGLGCLRYTTPR